MQKIQWQPLFERHQRGASQLGAWWIRVDRAGKVQALYLVEPTETHKWVPDDPAEEEIETMQLRAEYLIDSFLFARELAKKNQ